LVMSSTLVIFWPRGRFPNALIAASSHDNDHHDHFVVVSQLLSWDLMESELSLLKVIFSPITTPEMTWRWSRDGNLANQMGVSQFLPFTNVA
jgi:hypothetical protein